MSYFDSPDVVTTHESLEEDEELRQVLEQCVATASTMVWRQVARECQDMYQAFEAWVLQLLCLLLGMDNCTSQAFGLVETLAERVALTSLLFCVGFWLLAPSTRNSSKKSSLLHMLHKRQIRSWIFNDDSVGSANSEEESSHGFVAQQWDTSDNAAENDEERFEHNWSTVSLSRYRKLVLPPSCRKVEKPTPRQRVKAVMEAAAPTQKLRSNTFPNSSDHDDNPTARFQHYSDYLFSCMSFGSARGSLEEEDEDEKTKENSDDSDDNNSRAGNGDASFETPDTASTTDTPEGFQTPTREKHKEATLESLTPALLMPSPPCEEEKKDGGLTNDFHLHDRRRNSDASQYYETVLNDIGEGGETSTPDLPRQPLVPIRKNKDALASYRKVHEKLPNIRISSSPTPLPDSLEPEDEPGVEHGLEEPEEDESFIPEPPSPRSQKYFFATVNSDESMKRLQIDVPVPDKNGYILGDDFLPDTRYTPLLVFVNSRSGPQQGQLLITQLRRLLNPMQVWDLADGPPDPVLSSFCVFTRLRILVCGGDGTVSWIVSCLEKLDLKRKWPPIAILPLGTGNDLARVLGWGGGYNNESLITILEQISESYASLLDLYEVTVEDKNRKEKMKKTCFNYLGVGADAQAALQVHNLRESRPEWFFSRMVNKAFYGVFGAEDILKATSVHVRRNIKLIADGVEIPLPADSQGIILLNIDSYAGGVPLWSHGVKVEPPTNLAGMSPRRTKSMGHVPSLNQNKSIDRVDSLESVQDCLTEDDRIAAVTACERPSSYQDGYLDIVSIRGAFHLGQIKVGLSNAQRLCQCREASITIKSKVAVQVDGEPWRQSPCTVRIRRKDSPAVMLHRSADDGGVETEMSKLLDWAEERRLVDSQVHSILMKEFSRRIESKTRKRRVRAQDNQLIHTLKKAISSGAMANMGSTSNQWQHGGIAF